MRWRRFTRLAALLVLLSLPSFVVFAALAAGGALAAKPAAIAGTAVALLTWLAVLPFAVAAGDARDAMDALAADLAAGAALPAQTPTPARGPLGTALGRLVRLWRERLSNAETRLAAAEAIVAAVPDPLILLDAKRRIVQANSHGAEFVGAVAEPRDLAATLRNPAVLAAADAVIGGEPARTVEFVTAVPVERWLCARLARLDRPSPDGAVAILSVYDITALKRAEQLRADFIANASHELKTPLATLLGFIETLRGAARSDTKARERFLAIMHQQTVRMTRLVEDLLSLSRIELNEHVAPTGRVALAPLLQQIADSLELRAAERGMRIVLALAPDLPDLIGERDQLAQVFQNLIDNAIKYARAESEVTVRAALVSAAGRDPTAAPLVRAAVEDHGEGIPSDHLPRLTERFYRVDAARSREMGGTGLGLAIVKHIVSRHRGSLEIASTLGTGSVFAVYLRADTRPPEIVPDPDQPSDAAV